MPTFLLTIVLGVCLAIAGRLARRRYRRLLATIEVIVLRDVISVTLGNQRDVTVFLPPGYRQDNTTRYETLYINDGQEYRALGLRESLARMAAAGVMRPVIAVAIPTSDNRLHEYGTAVAANSLGLGALAAAYRRFVVGELMPRIDAEFRTLPRGAFLGVSLGGLSAFDISWSCPERFATVGVMSGSFWWRAADDEPCSAPGRRIPHSVVHRTAVAPDLRLWFQAGTRDEVCDRDGDGVIDSIQDTLELIDELRRVGIPGERISYVEVSGGRHDYDTWARVLPDFLEWAFTPGQLPHRAGQLSASHPPP